MPNIKSAKKRVKTDAKKKVANKNNASSMRTAIKKVRAEIKNEVINSYLGSLWLILEPLAFMLIYYL